jgi:hypothetical protein
LLTDLLNRFIASLTYALSVNRYGLVVPSRMLPAMQDMQQLEAEVQRLQDENTAMKAQQKSLEFYIQDSRRYRFWRNSLDAEFCMPFKSSSLHGEALDSYTDTIIGKHAKDFSNCTFEVGKPSVELPPQFK